MPKPASEAALADVAARAALSRLIPKPADLAGSAGEDLGDYDDINTAQEKKLGGIVKQRYGTDFFSVHR